MRTVRFLATAALWVLYGLGLGLLLALVLPLAVGCRPLVVLSGSMEPVLRTGDVTVVERIAPRDAHVGDVVTFKAPGTGRVTTHRVRTRRFENGAYVFTTKGDANNATERWMLLADGELGRAVYRIPKLGHVFLFVRTPLGRMLFLGVPLALLGAGELRRIWRPRVEGGDARSLA